MEIKVKAVDSTPQKSVQQVEEELLQKHEEEVSTEQAIETENVAVETKEIEETEVLSFIKDRYDKEINSLNDLFEARNNTPELPEDVKSYLDYRKDTGRGFEDYLKINKDYSKEDPSKVLFDYYTEKEPELDKEEIEFLIESKFSTNESIDSEDAIKQKTIERKKELSKALKHFESQKEKYKSAVESTGDNLVEGSEEYKAFKEYKENSKNQGEIISERSAKFLDRTNQLFGDEFKGFKFKIEDKEYVYSPGDKDELKKSQSDIINFISKFTNENGEVSDVNGYHRSLSVAMNPEKFAKHFYEMGMSEGLESQNKKMKNIDFKTRSTPEAVSKGGLKVKVSNPTSRRGLLIKSNKK